MKARACCFLTPVALLATHVALAIEVQHVDTRYQNGNYELEIEATLDAPTAAVRRVLSDYSYYPQLDDRVLDAKVLERPSAHEVLLYSRLRMCVAFFCRRVERVERVEERTDELFATAIPDRSDVKFGRTRTQWSAASDSTTHLVYRTEIQPKFWIPRLLPRRSMLNTLRDATIDLLTQVERTAQVAEQPAASSQRE